MPIFDSLCRTTNYMVLQKYVPGIKFLPPRHHTTAEKARRFAPSLIFYSVSPRIYFTAFSALLDADMMKWLSFFRTCNQFCMYAVEFLKVPVVSIPNRFIIIAEPASAVNSSLLYVSLPKCAFTVVSSRSSLVLCPVEWMSSWNKVL